MQPVQKITGPFLTRFDIHLPNGHIPLPIHVCNSYTYVHGRLVHQIPDCKEPKCPAARKWESECGLFLCQVLPGSQSPELSPRLSAMAPPDIVRRRGPSSVAPFTRSSQTGETVHGWGAGHRDCLGRGGPEALGRPSSSPQCQPCRACNGHNSWTCTVAPECKSHSSDRRRREETGWKGWDRA